MGSFIEIDLDLDYLDDLEQITVHDETGLHDDAEFFLGGLLDKDNGKLRDLVREMHAAYIDMTNNYENSEMDAIFEYSTNPIDAGKELKDKCETERHRFDAAMRELGIEVDK